MNNKCKIAFIGGDRRQCSAARVLADAADVYAFCLSESGIGDERVKCVEELEVATENASAIVLPLPASSDGVHLNCSFDDGRKIKLQSILKVADRSTHICGGKLPPAFVSSAEEKGFLLFDYFESEELQIKNAYTTAEAALSVAMNALSKNICGANIAISGYGRIAKHLARILLSLGANVTVAARRQSELAWAESCGCDTVLIDGGGGLYSLTQGYDIIYNTVPSWIFDRKFLGALDKRTIMIELASAPGGIDICAAKELSVNIIWALSLPGKYAPISAGEHIAECLLRGFSERGML